MNYRQNQLISNFGDRVGVGSTSRVGLSQRSTSIINKQNMGLMMRIMERSSSCWKINVRNLGKLKRSSNMIWIVKEN